MNLKATIEKVKDYAKEVYLEGKRVTWPSRKEVLKGTWVVLIVVFIAAIFLGFVDMGLAKMIEMILRQ